MLGWFRRYSALASAVMRLPAEERAVRLVAIQHAHLAVLAGACEPGWGAIMERAEQYRVIFDAYAEGRADRHTFAALAQDHPDNRFADARRAV